MFLRKHLNILNYIYTTMCQLPAVDMDSTRANLRGKNSRTTSSFKLLRSSTCFLFKFSKRFRFHFPNCENHTIWGLVACMQLSAAGVVLSPALSTGVAGVCRLAVGLHAFQVLKEDHKLEPRL